VLRVGASGTLRPAALGVLLAAGMSWASVRAENVPAVPVSAVRHVQHPSATAGLEARVQTLSRALELDQRQQAELRAVLQDQRNQITRVWNDASMPAAIKVSSTQAIGDRTASRIRELLNDEQRNKYTQPRQRGPTVGAGGADLASWMGSREPLQAGQ